MQKIADDNWQFETALLAKVEQCRRLAAGIRDPVTAGRLRDLADEYMKHIKSGAAH
jgi:hypothetical protein